MTQTAITFGVDTDKLDSYTDQHLAVLWHVAQANPAPYGDRDAAELVKHIGWEIIRRWLKAAPVELYHHQADAPATAVRMKTATYRPGGADDRDNAFHDGVWTLDPDALDAALAGPPAGTTCPHCAAQQDLLRVEYGPGAGQVWICRDAAACRLRRWQAAEADDSLVCARCGRLPGVAAAAAELVQATGPVDLGGDNAPYGPITGDLWVCVDRQRCDDRISRGARPPRQHDRDMDIRVAEVGVANALREGLGPAVCEKCGNAVPAELNAPHRMPKGLAKTVGRGIAGAWLCRDTDACEARARNGQADDAGDGAR